MKANLFSLVVRVIAIDISAIAVYWLLACGVDALTQLVPGWLSMTLIVVIWATLFFALFFSNAQLFGWMKNSYAWSLTTGILTLLITVPVIIISAHKPCFF